MFPAARESSFYDSMAFCPRMYSQRGLMEGKKNHIDPTVIPTCSRDPRIIFHMNKT